MTARLIDRDRKPEDADTHLRPQTLSEFVGQSKTKQNLRVFIKGGDDQPTEKLIRLALKEMALS